MTVRHRRSVIGLLAASLGIIGVFAFGASSASAQEGSVDFFAYLDEGQQTTVVGVPGGAVGARCQPFDESVGLALVGTASNGLAKATWVEPGSNQTNSRQQDDLDTGETMQMNGFPGSETDEEVTGHMEFVNGAGSRNLTAQYSTEGGADFAGIGSDCAVWGSAVKRFM